MKRIFSLISFILVTSTAIAQNSNYAKFAEELLLWSNNTYKESLPQDCGVMILENLSITPDAVNYFYIIKDETIFKSYKDNQVELKNTLELTLKQTITSTASSILFCLDADKGMCYHYANKAGESFTISFTRPDLFRILGREYIDAEYRENIVSGTIQLIMASLPKEENFQMSYGGIKDNCVVYNIYTDGTWADGGYKVNLEEIVTKDVVDQNPSIFFHLISLYLSKGEIYSVEDRQTRSRSEDKLSPEQLRAVYEMAVAKTNNHFNEFNVPPLPAPIEQNSNETNIDDSEPIPYLLIEVKPTFLGGDINKFCQWVASEIMYPIKAKKQGLSGRVVLSFTIEKNGSVTNVKVLRGVHDLLDNEAVRIVRESPRWNPGQHRGQLRRCTYTLPIIFDPANIQDSGDNNGYYWVDLGLSVRWAESNLGATTPYEYGDFYSWGALSPTYSYSPDMSKTFNAPVENICAKQDYDVARVNRKSTWRIPTKDECEELIKNCTWIWTIKNGVPGFEVKSKVNSNSIFLPASGVYESPENKSYTGELGCYWTSNPADKKYMESYLKEAFVLRFTSSGPYTLYYNKYFGYSIRPVCD